MTRDVLDYSDLPIEDTWVDYLRTRLPYSFSEISKENSRRYILSGPHLPSTTFAEYHNFWKRGHVYYAVGKLTDIQKLSLYWQNYHISHTDPLRNEYSGKVDLLAKSPPDVFNALQLEKLWAVVAADHLDRERVVMTNVTQAIEFCLKAIKTHAEYRETGLFSFTEGHNLEEIYTSLPKKLQLEMRTESITFADNYATFRKMIEDGVSRLGKRRLTTMGTPPDVRAWQDISDEIDRTTYTAFVGVNDPASANAVDSEPEEWFDRAIKNVGEITYHRYSPFRGRDNYPVEPIHQGLLLARFMYEHLFPVTAVPE